MAKRRASGEKGHATPRPRKKQAVTKTNSGKIKAIIRENASNSPLLSLPSEIREKILINLVGNNLIHVKHLAGRKLAEAKGIPYDEFRTPNLQLAKEGAFRHAICVATQSEQAVYNEHVLFNTMVPEDYETTSANSPVSEDDRLNGNPSSCGVRHDRCKMTKGGSTTLLPEDYGSLTLDLKVLGVSRQLYEEANHLLWTTNIFSFDDAISLNKFLASLNPAQKRKMSGIHLSAKLDSYDSGRWEQAWSVALKMSYINMLRGVQNLHLCFALCYASLTFPAYVKSYEVCKASIESDIKPFLRLRALNTKNITVLLSDTAGTVSEVDQASFKLNQMTRIEYAEHIRVQLLAANGAELVNQDAEIAKAANEVAMMKNAKVNISITQLRLESFRESMDECKARAECEDKEVEKLAAKTAKISGESKKALSRKAKLQDNAYMHEINAERLWRHWKRASERLTSFEEKAAEAEAKYQRAKARVNARRAKNGLPIEEEVTESDEENDSIGPSGSEEGYNSDEIPLSWKGWDKESSENEGSGSDEEFLQNDYEEVSTGQHHMEGMDEEEEVLFEDYLTDDALR